MEKEKTDSRRGWWFSEIHFNMADVVLIALAMVLLVTVTWRVLVVMPRERPETVSLDVRMCVDRIPDGAEGKIAVGDLLYTPEGQTFGKVSRISYLPEEGVIRAYLEVSLEGEKLYNGYGIPDEKGLLLNLGRFYALHTADYGGQFECMGIREH